MLTNPNIGTVVGYAIAIPLTMATIYLDALAQEKIEKGQFGNKTNFLKYHLSVAANVDLRDLKLPLEEKIDKYPLLSLYAGI